MANAADSKTCKFEFIDITKDSKKIPLIGKMTTFDYYESLLSPNVTAKLSYVDTGGGVKHDGKYDTQERVGTIYNSLPIESQGEEKINFKLTNSLGTLDYTTKTLVINGSANLDQESNRESVILDLISQVGHKNLQEEVRKNYTGLSTNSLIVSKIGQEKLGITINVDPTKNKYPFIGNKKKPFEILMMLATKSVPLEGNPGYFFYETRDGHNFFAIDSLISKTPVATYYKTDVNRSSNTTDTNFKIAKATIVKNQNLVDAEKAGVNSSKRIFWNPKTFIEEEFNETIETLPNALGKNDPPKPTNTKPTRIFYSILDVGALSPDTKETKENSGDPKEWQGKVDMRYNLLLSQAIQIEVPLNPTLKAGDIINCNFEMVTEGDKCDGTPDPTQSGAYMIMDLCHHYDTKRSFTSMLVVRDTYGLYTNNKSNNPAQIDNTLMSGTTLGLSNTIA
tara:strand:- start:2964 stop:4316 length:1353 start_codon:yes stop_codon:yes gene_type:complete